MTKEELDKLTDEEKRVRIAALCGWKRGRTGNWSPPGTDDDNWPMSSVPDYLNSLDAMWDAEEFLGGPTDYKWCGYVTHLNDITGPSGSNVHSTARQRADAFLLTLG